MVGTETLYLAVLIASIPIMGSALYYVLNDLDVRGAKPLAVLVVGSLLWVVTTVVYTFASTFTVALYANRASYFGITLVVVGWVLFALEYTGYDEYVSAPSVGLLALEPLAVYALVWTNTTHDLWRVIARRGATYATSGGTTATCNAAICFGVKGQGFLLHTVYSYVLLLVGAGLVLRRVYSAASIGRAQAGAMIVAVAAPLLGNVLSLFVLPAGTPDLTPLMFSVSGLAIVVGIYRYSLVDETALAAAAGIADRDRPAFLVDDRDSIVDINAKGGAVLRVDADEIVGADVGEAFADAPDLRERYEDDDRTAAGLTVENDLTGDRYEVRTETVETAGHGRTGTLFVLDPLAESSQPGSYEATAGE